MYRYLFTDFHLMIGLMKLSCEIEMIFPPFDINLHHSRISDC